MKGISKESLASGKRTQEDLFFSPLYELLFPIIPGGPWASLGRMGRGLEDVIGPEGTKCRGQKPLEGCSIGMEITPDWFWI